MELSTINVGGCIMYVARLTHIATGYPKQVEISIFDYLGVKVLKSGYDALCDSLQS